jgi:hypothetical protein
MRRLNHLLRRNCIRLSINRLRIAVAMTNFHDSPCDTN